MLGVGPKHRIALLPGHWASACHMHSKTARFANTGRRGGRRQQLSFSSHSSQHRHASPLLFFFLDLQQQDPASQIKFLCSVFSMFSGLSTLRKAEKKEPTPQNKALSDYLKRQYGGGTAEDEPKRKKKKKSKQGPSAIAILDADITGLPSVSEAGAKPARQELDAADDSEGALCRRCCYCCCCCCCSANMLHGPSCMPCNES